MRNRAFSVAPAPLRGPLLAALNVEYERAVKAKNLSRMAEVSAVIEALQHLWPNLAPAPVPAPVVVAMPPAPPPMPEPEPAPPALLAVEALVAPLPPPPQEVGGLSMRDILHRADPMPPVVIGNGQSERRREAREQVSHVVAEETRLTSADQFKYELALMVANENIEAMADMQAAATAAGLPVKAYAQRTIAQHHARRRRAAQIYAIEEQALKAIDTATGDTIDAIAAGAVRDIRGEDA